MGYNTVILHSFNDFRELVSEILAWLAEKTPEKVLMWEFLAQNVYTFLCLLYFSIFAFFNL